ncbi:hypothetical protein AGRA3207_005841 [Actinomadura graeca]|uniref:Phospholipid carrier-dependent glycosyltransferase n=1 Tax=Actinomadura graeca TaxID=2750812 RepID=A0ABX8R1S8_9ACTN|nr:hypothetical protein [Actinomadura graeca]QXJ24506.1 hypothetical protein AGRA3207_005841 [Actinomadura graeca]
MLTPPKARWPKAEPVRAAVRGNRPFTALLLAGVLLRLVAMLGYPPALWFNDSYDYLRIANAPFPHPLRSEGYGLFLWLLKPFHSLYLVTGLQHAAVVAMAAFGYRALVRDFRVRRHWAALALAPVLLDGYQIELEHLLLSDTLFTVLVFCAVLLIARPGAAGWRRAGLAGALLGLAAVTRTVGVPLIAVAVLYLLVRRTRWPAHAALAAAFLLPLGGYAAWFHHDHGRFAMTGADGVYLWGRASAFADCDRFAPPPDLAALCPYGAPGDRPASSHQIWEAGSPTGWRDGRPFDPVTNDKAQRFAMWAIGNQPLDYARVVAYDFFGRTFTWRRSPYPQPGTENKYRFPERPDRMRPLPVIGGGDRLSVVREYEHGSGRTRVVSPFADMIRGYQSVVNVRGTMLGAVLLAGAAGILLRRARRGAGLFWLTGTALLAVPPLTADFDYRYLLPALPFACLAAVTAWGRRPDAGPEPEPAEPGPTEREAEVQPAGR